MTMSNLLNIKDRSYIITGAASGIGRATALLLSELGARLLLVDIDESKLLQVQSQCQGETDLLVLDLTDAQSIKMAITRKVATFGKLHGYVHCAGLPYIAPIKVVNAEKAEKLYRLNVYAAIELAKVCSSKKVYAGEYGSFVLISSVYGLVGSAANVGYAMSKGAIISVTKSMAIELAQQGIRVNCIAPGFIKTPMANKVDGMMDEDYDNRLNALHPLGLGQAEDIANAILFLFSDMSKWITGAVLSVDGGFTAQ